MRLTAHMGLYYKLYSTGCSTNALTCIPFSHAGRATCIILCSNSPTEVHQRGLWNLVHIADQRSVAGPVMLVLSGYCMQRRIACPYSQVGDGPHQIPATAG